LRAGLCATDEGERHGGAHHAGTGEGLEHGLSPECCGSSARAKA
jgi:hypothetical protein